MRALRVATTVRDLAELGFPEPICTMQVAAELLAFPTTRALQAWLRRRREQFPPRYMKHGLMKFQRVLTASECRTISASRLVERLPGGRAHQQTVDLVHDGATMLATA